MVDSGKERLNLPAAIERVKYGYRFTAVQIPFVVKYLEMHYQSVQGTISVEELEDYADSLWRNANISSDDLDIAENWLFANDPPRENEGDSTVRQVDFNPENNFDNLPPGEVEERASA